MAPASARSDALALGLSLGAAATSAYVLWKTTQEPKQAPTDKKLEKSSSSKLAKLAQDRVLDHGARPGRHQGLPRPRSGQGRGGHDASPSSPCGTTSRSSPRAARRAASCSTLYAKYQNVRARNFEVATTEGATPIKQDEKKGVLREFKKGDIFFNYGCFPRTWEDPRHVSPDTGYPGDNDPLDVDARSACARSRRARSDRSRFWACSR